MRNATKTVKSGSDRRPGKDKGGTADRTIDADRAGLRKSGRPRPPPGADREACAIVRSLRGSRRSRDSLTRSLALTGNPANAGSRAPRAGGGRAPAGAGSAGSRRDARLRRQQVEPAGQVLHMACDQMDDLAGALHPSPHQGEARGQHRPAVPLQNVGPDHDVHGSGLVLQGHEDHALRAARPLARQHEPGRSRGLAGAGRAPPPRRASAPRAASRPRRKESGCARSERRSAR